MIEPGGNTSGPRPDQREVDTVEVGNASTIRESIREGVSMALYVSLSLLAVMAALPPDLDPGASLRPALTIFLTSLGLILSHALAFRMSTRLAHRGQLTAASVELLLVQFIGGLAVTVVAVAPVLLIGGPDGVRASELLLLAFVAVVGYVAVRAVPVSRPRALAYAMMVVVATLVVIWVKSLVPH
jgi:hypothetical protein